MTSVPAPFDPAHPGAQATLLAQDLGARVLDVAVHLAPIAVPFVLALTAIGWAMEKFGLNGRIELAHLEREAREAEAARIARAERRASRKQDKWNAMVDDAYTENRRRNLRKRFTGSY